MNWVYYKHAMVPNCLPHEEVDTSAVEDGSVWKYKGKTILFARWTTDFDCGYETSFWYVIKDGKYDIQVLKAKRRYEITKSRRFFEIRKINPIEFSEKMYEVQSAAFEDYPEKYRPAITRETFIARCSKWKGVCFGAFLKDESGGGMQHLSFADILTWKLTGNILIFVFKKLILNMNQAE